MGFYINPTDMTKEQWFKKHAMAMFPYPVETNYRPDSDSVACVLVDNGMFTALGIAYSEREREDFSMMDGRAKVWGYFPRKLIEPYLHGQEIEGVVYE